MAPSASTTTTQPLKIKRPTPAHIQTNGINSSTSSPSPSISSSRLPGVAKYPPNSATGNGMGGPNSGARTANRSRKDGQAQLLGRGQRNNSVGLRSASLIAEMAAPHSSGPQAYIKTEEYILKKYRGNPPSLIIHMHATHFRFDTQEGSFSYKSPMRIMIDHLKLRTIPHDLSEFFAVSNVPFYEGCMIVQVYDHKTTAPSQGSNRANTGSGKTAPFSVHNSNAYLTHSPYVPFPKEPQASKGRNHLEAENDLSGKGKSTEQKDKENMPAPAVPADGQRGKAGVLSKKPKVFTVVLHPTAVSKYADLAITVVDSRSNHTESRQDAILGGPLSATVPPTPSTAILPPTPQTSMAPPAKRLKRSKVELDGSNIHTAESQITLATTAPLMLEPVHSAVESAALLEALTHPMHSNKPPSPKTRKRTVAEMEADEALAAEQERYMLILDERLSSSTAGAQGGANPADSDGQAGGASFEPRFERFKTIENIRASHEETKKAEKARQIEAERKSAQERERERLRLEAEKRDHEKIRQQNLLNNSAAVRQQQQEAARRAMAAQQMNSQAGGMPQAQGQHSHPQNNGLIGNGIQTQPQRFHHQQVSQAQASSPIVRNGTPLNHSSPSMNNVGNMPMPNSNSSMAGSPPRPSSVVHQNHAPMSATSHGMTTQRSQQSHAGTPRMPNATPSMQSTPINRAISQTPRMSQASPPQGQMVQVPMQMINGGHQPINAQQQAAMMAHQQQMRQNAMRQQQANLNNIAMANGQPMTPAQQQQQRYLMMQAVAQGNQMQNPAMMAQNYSQRLAGMGMQQPQGLPQGAMPQNMGFNQGMPVNMANMNMQQIQQIHMQQQAAQQAQQQQQQAQMQAAQQAQGQGRVQPTPQQIMQIQVQRNTQILFQNQLPQIQAQYPGGNVPQEVLAQLKASCHQNAMAMVTSNMRKRQMMVQQQQQQQNAMAQQNAIQMQNGMGMQGQGM